MRAKRRFGLWAGSLLLEHMQKERGASMRLLRALMPDYAGKRV